MKGEYQTIDVWEAQGRLIWPDRVRIKHVGRGPDGPWVCLFNEPCLAYQTPRPDGTVMVCIEEDADVG